MTKQNHTFTMKFNGRCGHIVYQSDDNRISIDWEMSGTKKYNILLAPLDLREWDEAKGTKIPLNRQLEILQELREWLQKKKIKTDIDMPLELEFKNKACIWAECNEKRLKDSVYCLSHFDKILLTQ